MRNIFLMILAILFTDNIIHNTAFAQECADQIKLENREFIRSEDLNDEPGLYTIKYLDGSDVQALMIATRDLQNYPNRKTGKNFTQKDIRGYKHSIMRYKDFYKIYITTGESEPGSLDGYWTYIFKIDSKDFSIKSRRRH